MQSDEISILLNNYSELDTSPWFDNNIQKMVSVAAGYASSYFTSVSKDVFGETKLACFDARAFVLPKEEVNNAFLWRERDAERNSLNTFAREYFSNKQLLNKKQPEVHDMLHSVGVNWNDLPINYRRGRCIVKEQITTAKEVVRHRWIVDNSIPIFSQDPNYIEKFL